MTRRKILMFFQFLISIGLVSYLIFLVDWSKAFNILKKSEEIYLIIGFFLLVFGLFFASLRWYLILKDNNLEFSVLKSYKGYLRGMFYNIFLPGVVGGDVIRIGICRFQTDCELGIATASVLLERISGIFSLFVTSTLINRLRKNFIFNSNIFEIICFAILCSGNSIFFNSIFPLFRDDGSNFKYGWYSRMCLLFWV